MFRCFLGRLLPLAFLTITSCSWEKSDPETAANTFFQLLAQNQLQSAFASTAFGFQIQQNFATFEVNVRDLGLGGNSALGWSVKSITKKEMLLDGEITFPGGHTRRIGVTTVRDGRLWKIFALHTPVEIGGAPLENRFTSIGRSVGFNYAINRKRPLIGEIAVLVRETLLNFNEGIKQKSFSRFYESLSEAWKSQLLERRFQQTFQPFIDQNINLDSLARLKPVFEVEPYLNAEGILVVSGNYPTEPYRTDFRLKYIYELPRWKLYGINVDLVK